MRKFYGFSLTKFSVILLVSYSIVILFVFQSEVSRRLLILSIFGVYETLYILFWSRPGGGGGRPCSSNMKNDVPTPIEINISFICEIGEWSSLL